MRPILTSVKSASSQLEKFLNPILLKLTENSKFIIKPTMDFVPKISQVKVPRGFSLISADIKDMFNQISREKLFSDLKELLSKTGQDTLNGCTPNGILKMVKTVIENTNFVANSCQPRTMNEGIPTGSSFSVALCNIRLNGFENTHISKNKNFFWYGRYIDDILAVVKTSEINEIVKSLNSEEFKFSIEKESFHTRQNMIGIPYLDKFCFVQNRQIKFKWFQKEHKIGQIMDFNSASPNTWKKSIVIGAYKRIAYSCSNPEFFDSDIKTFHETLRMNRYPKNFIANLQADLKRIKSERFEHVTVRKEKNNILSDRKKIIAKFPFHSPEIHSMLIKLKWKLTRELPETIFHFIITSFKLDNLFFQKTDLSILPQKIKQTKYIHLDALAQRNMLGKPHLPWQAE